MIVTKLCSVSVTFLLNYGNKMLFMSMTCGVGWQIIIGQDIEDRLSSKKIRYSKRFG